MPEWTQGTITVNGLEVFYRRTGAGSGRPAMLLLHGYTDNGACWTPVAQALEADFDVVMPDARGHGRTRGPVDGLQVETMGDDAAAIARALGLEKPVLFGHSMGGMTALAAAVQHPELVRAAILEDPPFMRADPNPPTDAEVHSARAFQQLPLEERLARGRVLTPHWSEAELVPWAESKGEYNPEILTIRQRIRNYAWRDGLSRVTCPVLLITAETAKGGLITPEIAADVRRICPTCEVAHIDGAGHCIHRDRMDETMQRVRTFLARV